MVISCGKSFIIKRIYGGDGYKDWYLFDMSGEPIRGKVIRKSVYFYKKLEIDACYDYPTDCSLNDFAIVPALVLPSPNPFSHAFMDNEQISKIP